MYLKGNGKILNSVLHFHAIFPFHLKPESSLILYLSPKPYVLVHFFILFSKCYKEVKISHQKHKLGLKPLEPQPNTIQHGNATIYWTKSCCLFCIKHWEKDTSKRHLVPTLIKHSLGALISTKASSPKKV